MRALAISLVERARVCVEAAVRVHAAVRVEGGVAPAARERAVRGDLERVVARLAADEALARELGLDASLVRIDVLLVLRACARRQLTISPPSTRASRAAHPHPVRPLRAPAEALDCEALAGAA